MHRKIIAAALLIGLGAALPWLLTEQAWIGSYQLSLTVEADETTLSQPMRMNLVYEREMAGVMQTPWTDEPDPVTTRVSTNQWLLTGEAMGRRGVFTDTYHCQDYLVIEFVPSSNTNHLRVRKSFRVPPGRGDRSMEISLHE